jgi:orotate phosphoribosyltransferase-like protein
MCIKGAIRLALQIQEDFECDTIAFSGHSGSALAFILAHELHLPLLCVRKSQDDSHFNFDYNKGVEGNISTRKYFIVDDLITSGTTMNRIVRSIQDAIPEAQCAAILLYNSWVRGAWKGIPVYTYQPSEEDFQS